MQVEFVKVKYMHCDISLYSKATSGISSNKTKITNFPLYFPLKPISFRIILKRIISSNISYVLTIYSLLVLMLMTNIPLSLVQSQNKSQETDPMRAGSSVGIATEYSLDG